MHACGRWLVSVKPTSESRAPAASRGASSAPLGRVRFRNLRRAGMLKNRSPTSISVPRAPPASTHAPPTPPSTRISVPLGAARARPQREARHRGDRRQRLAAEAERARRARGRRRCGSCWWRGARARAAHRPAPCRRRRPRRGSAACRRARRRSATRRAPASSAFSTSSLTTEAGRSTTSPAAIWLTRSAGSARMRPTATSPRADRKNRQHRAETIVSMMARIHQNWAASPPGKRGSGDVHSPHPGQDRQRHEDRRRGRSGPS